MQFSPTCAGWQKSMVFTSAVYNNKYGGRSESESGKFHAWFTVLCKSNANVFRQNSWLFLAFRQKNIEFLMEANFQRKVTIIRGAYCSLLCKFSNFNSFGTKSDFEFSSEKVLCSINDFKHLSEISLFISSPQTFPSILWTTICQVRSCRNDSFVLSSH